MKQTKAPRNPSKAQPPPKTVALPVSEARMAAIMEVALDCIVTIDHEGRIVDWNPAAERTFGFSRAQTVGREMAELIIPPALRQRHRAGLARAVGTGKDTLVGRRVEITAVRADGTEFPVELAITRIATGGPPLFTGHIRDISEVKQAAHRQAAEYAVGRVLAEAGSVEAAAPRLLEAVCENLQWDVGAFWRVNPEGKSLSCVALYQRSGVAAEAFLDATRRFNFERGRGLPGRIWDRGEPVWIPDVVQDANFPRAKFALKNALHAAFGFPIRLDGEVLGVIEFFHRCVHPQDEPTLETFGSLGRQIGQFIQRAEAEDEVRRLNRELEQRIAGRTAELEKAKEDLRRALEQERELGELKSRFVSMVSHEFRTPLGITMSAVELLRNYLDRLPKDKLAELLNDIHSSTLRMSGLMEQVLLLGRVEAGRVAFQSAPLQLKTLGARLTDETHSATQHKCPIEFRAEGKLAGARGDEALLRHIFSNLLSNAVKYSCAGRPVEFELRREGGDAAFMVRDRGIGIPEADQARLFEAFHRGGNVGEITGTGLGLLIVKRCVEMHRGTITFDSHAGEGTTFTVRLPLFAEAP
jgi:PAS domain S-box-containing protein